MAPANNKVLLCERGAGIGTQVTFSAKFLKNPCAGRYSLPIAAPRATFADVVLNNSFDNMDQCLHTAHAANRWAIGITSLDKDVPDTATGAIPFNYRFIKIDGVESTLRRVHDSSYPWWEELTAQWKNTLRGNTLKVAQQLVRDAAQSATIRPRNKNHKFGPSGYLALTSSNLSLGTSNTVDAVFRARNPVTAYTHSFGVNAASICRVPTIDQGLFPQVLPFN